MQKLLAVLMFVMLLIVAVPVVTQDDATLELTILAKQNLALHSKPDFYSNVLGIFESGEELKAFGRDAVAGWLQTALGWVNARNIAADGDIMTLRMTADTITLQAAKNLKLRGGPDESYSITATLPESQLSIAIGRNYDGAWLETPKGWIHKSAVDFDGDIMSLPVTFASITITAAKNGAFLSAPTWEADVLEIFPRGDDAFAYERSEDSKWVKTPRGWVNVGRGIDIVGALKILPTANLLPLTASAETRVFAGPGTDYDVVGRLQIGDETIALRRTEDGSWLETPTGWISADTVSTSGGLSRPPILPSGIKVSVTNAGGRTSVRDKPSYISSRVVASLQRGVEALAIGRNESGTWLRIEKGWVNLRYIKAEEDIMTLPVTDGKITSAEVSGDLLRLPVLPIGVRITISRFATVRERPRYSGSPEVGVLQPGDEALATGRNESGNWLLLENGWVNAYYIKADGDIMTLPVTDGVAASTVAKSSSPQATPTPKPDPAPASGLDARTIRSLVSRHTDDIRILDIQTSGRITTIEYDLKPWPFVPNEQIANEVTFKIICAIRVGQRIPNALKFIGQSHFKSDVGRKFTAPSVEIQISSNNANRIVCAGNDYSDINWRSISSVYKSHPIPRGASVDYD